MKVFPKALAAWQDQPWQEVWERDKHFKSLLVVCSSPFFVAQKFSELWL
jgi:hypothetical protein